MKESTARLDDLDTYISNLQGNYSRAYASALESTAVLSGRLLDQDTMQAREELSLAYGRQGNLFTQTSSANDILVANSQLIALGLMVAGETNRLFTLDSIAELDTLDGHIRTLFTRIHERVVMLETMLTRLNAMEELKILRAASASLAIVRNKIYAPDGIVTTLKQKQGAITRANALSDKLHAIVSKQSAKGNASISAAKFEQDKAIAAVNSMVRQSLSQIFGIGIAAIVIGIIFGLWMYKSLLQSLQLVLAAVSSQQDKVKEKAALATAVAGGDLSRDVAVGEALQLDPSQLKKDEMGIVLKAVVGMSQAQVTLDRAFAAMTASLRSSREEEARRDRLKSGLFELNHILRGEHGITDLADRALAFLATFLGAGAGVIYLYDDRAGLLHTLSTYAVARSERLADGFRLGEGLAGQVAQEQKMRCLTTVPANYLPITSALGEAAPLAVAILPIMHNDTLVGVLELASFKQFTADNFEFLQLSLEGIAIAISVNRSRLQIHESCQRAEHMTVESA